MTEEGTLTFGSPELWATAAGTLVVFGAFAVSYYLTWRASRTPYGSAARA